MPAITRTNDISIGTCACCCDSCPHTWVSVHTSGSPNTYINNLQAMRAPGDTGSSTCPHCPTSFSVSGSSNTYINSLKAHRVGDVHNVPCGTGVVVSGSPNTFVNS